MLNIRSRLLVPAILGIGLALSGRADASLITYTESFAGSGTLGATSFNNVQITFSGVADTANVSSVAGFYSVTLGTPRVTIGGLGTFGISDPVQEFDNQNNSFLGVTDIVNGGTISLRNASVFDTYALMSPIGPVSGTTSNQGGTFSTSSGALHITSAAASASFTASAVPEPSSMLLATLGFGGVLSARRAARRRRAGRRSTGSPKTA